MFHVVETARIGPEKHDTLGSTRADGNNGAFDIVFEDPWRLFVIASDQGGWEHVSVHAHHVLTGQRRTPSWDEMCAIKKLFWDGEDVVMQLHPRESRYVNQHPHVLHLWRPTRGTIPEPPSEFVGRRGSRSR